MLTKVKQIIYERGGDGRYRTSIKTAAINLEQIATVEDDGYYDIQFPHTSKVIMKNGMAITLAMSVEDIYGLMANEQQ